MIIMKSIPMDTPEAVTRWMNENCTHVTNRHQYCAYIEEFNGKMIERTFACRGYKDGTRKHTEVRRRDIEGQECVLKNLLYSNIAGYIPVYEAKSKYSHSQGWSYKVFDRKDFDVWYETNLPCHFYYDIINPDAVLGTEAYKYCGYKRGDIVEYLKKYREHNCLEIFSKLNIPQDISLIKKAEKDSAFKKYIIKNNDLIWKYGSKATIYAYLHKMGIPDAAILLNDRREAFRRIPSLSGTKVDPIRIVEYCKKNNVEYRLYNDYFEAVKALGLNLEDTKNLYPRDFKRMHDLRIDEYAAQKIAIDRKKRKKLNNDFAQKGEAAREYETETECFKIVSAKDIQELVKEGTILKHCVGHMGYDVKMAEGRCLIFFLRKKESVDTPYVTIEYDRVRHRVAQAYGENNHTPSDDVMHVIKKWEKDIKKKGA